MGHYEVTLDAKQAAISVVACFDSAPPETLATGLSISSEFLIENSLQNLTLKRRNNELTYSSNNSCSRYSVDLEKAAIKRQARKINGSWLVNNRAWLWQPIDNAEFTIHFISPQKAPVAVSVPWILSSEGYLAGNTPIGWTSRMAFGNIVNLPIKLGNQTLRASILGINNQRKINSFKDWLTESVFAVSQLYGRFPIDQAQILVAPIGKRREAIPWAEVQRAGLPAAHLFIDQYRPIQEFKKDWTTVHELSHLLIPRIEYRDRWLSEGLASYYQNVAKARAGLLSEQHAWQKLKRGFAKGRKAFSGSLRSSRATKHLYWGGAAFFLLADIRLRNLPTPQTLDQVLDALQSCCLPNDTLWNAEQFVNKMDSLSDTTIFSDLLKNEAQANKFPISKLQQNSPDSLINLFIPEIMQTKRSLVETID
jgi:hypothetical protein